MANLKTIPDSVKWRLAARCAATLPAMYDIVFRSTVGNQYDELEQEIWIELSRMAVEMARDLSLPVGNAPDIAGSLRTVMAILFGPEYAGETLELSGGGAVILVKRCPLTACGQEMGGSPGAGFHRCMAFTLSFLPGLDKKFAGRFVRAMCMGDRQCEITVEPVQERRAPAENPPR